MRKQVDEWRNGNIPAEIRESAWIDVMLVTSEGALDVALCVPARGMNPNGAGIFPGWAWRLTAHTYDRASGRILP
ncbi:hypothetical protein [Mesorhizobium sp.]|uniref:hypothetical protein n=1 Tax=Mesorhizobium sp. TaxID=1871066 RepID=UPI000FE73343|nr:hypothetical protein [Mesorhizobium sp.]RWF33772.1 MAG: hypothetical protein EOS45_02240 [Mesorhizobium sp.]